MNVAVETFTADQFVDWPTGNGNSVDVSSAPFFGSQKDRFAVGTESKFINPRVQRFTQRTRLIRPSIIEHQAKAIAFVSWRDLRSICEVTTVGRVLRRTIVTMIVDGDIPGGA